MLDLNLQLFAEEFDDDDDVFLDDDLEDTETSDDPEDEELELDDDIDLDEEEDEEEIEDEDDPKVLDKKTKAIIKHKKENKELRRKLQALEEEKQANQLESEKSKRILELTKGGKSAEEATKIADDEIEIKKLRLQIARLDIDKLETKYPGISLFATQLVDDKAKLPEFTYEQIYQAKYAKKSQYDEKTKLEQELLAKTKTARKKSLESGSNKNTKTIKLSQQDEKVYQVLKKQNKSLTRKQYKELLEMEEMEI